MNFNFFKLNYFINIFYKWELVTVNVAQIVINMYHLSLNMILFSREKVDSGLTT